MKDVPPDPSPDGRIPRPKTSMYLPITEINKKKLGPKAIRNLVNGFAKD